MFLYEQVFNFDYFTRFPSFIFLQAKQKGATKFSSSSGGNAGLAAALAAKKLGLPISIVVPETCPSFIQEDLKRQVHRISIDK